MLYAVVDTNVLVSALLSSRKESHSNPWRVLDFIFSGDVIPVYNQDILDEYTDVLNRRKFHFDPDTVRALISELQRIGISQNEREQEVVTIMKSLFSQEDAVKEYGDEREIEGAVNLAKEMKMTDQQIEDYLMKKFNLTRDGAKKYLAPAYV